VPATNMQSGLVDVCTAKDSGGGCATDELFSVSFTVDTTVDEATIQIR